MASQKCQHSRVVALQATDLLYRACLPILSDRAVMKAHLNKQHLASQQNLDDQVYYLSFKSQQGLRLLVPLSLAFDLQSV